MLVSAHFTKQSHLLFFMERLLEGKTFTSQPTWWESEGILNRFYGCTHSTPLTEEVLGLCDLSQFRRSVLSAESHLFYLPRAVP